MPEEKEYYNDCSENEFNIQACIPYGYCMDDFVVEWFQKANNDILNANKEGLKWDMYM